MAIPFFVPKGAVVSSEHLPRPLCHRGCDKVSWLPEGNIFSHVQTEKIISKFLKESVLKRVFRPKQMRWEGLHCTLHLGATWGGTETNKGYLLPPGAPLPPPTCCSSLTDPSDSSAEHLGCRQPPLEAESWVSKESLQVDEQGWFLLPCRCLEVWGKEILGQNTSKH